MNTGGLKSPASLYLAFWIVKSMVKKSKNPGIRKKWTPESLDKAMEAL